MRRFLALMLVTCLGIAPAFCGALERTTRFDGAALVRDVDVLEDAYTSLHPGLYRYADEATVRSRFDALRAELRGGATLAGAYAAFSRFAATVRCGHTYANFHNQAPAARVALFESGRGRLPFHFRWIDGRMIVVRAAASAADLVPGTEVIAIDGVPAARILAALMPYARADGSNDAKRIAQLQVFGDEKYEPFDVYFPLAFPAAGERFELRIRAPSGGVPREVTVAGISYAERIAMRAAEPTTGARWTLDRPRPDLAVLAMPTWALYDSDRDWKAFLDESFDRLVADDVPALVIDLRANEGGLDVGDAILARLADRPVARPAYRHLVRYDRIPPRLRPVLDTWDRSFDDWGAQAIRRDARFYALTRWHPDGIDPPIEPKAPRYRGHVYVLVGPTNSSATFQFAQQVQSGGLGTLVGQPTGGNLRGINGSAFYFVRLPASGIELDLPLVAQFPLTPQPDRGLLPDIGVATTVDTLARGGDAEMEAVIEDLLRR